MNIKATYNQTLIDIALQGAGDVALLLQVAQFNGKSITDDVVAGTTLITPGATDDKQKIASFFNQLSYYPCSNGIAVAVAGVSDVVLITHTLSKSALRIQEGQEIIDMALQGCGDVTRLFDVAQLNAISITDELNAGDIINTPDAVLNKKNTATFFNSNPNYPASGTTAIDTNNNLEGIGYWYTTTPEPSTTVE